MDEKVKQIFNGLKEGEPYQFSLRGNKLIIGIRAGYDENYDEYEIFECDKVKNVKEGLFKLKRLKMNKERLLEKLADLEHQQWMEWSKAIAGADEKISEDRLDKWAGLWIPYKKLSEENKEKDRVFARKVLDVIESKEVKT